ncbi:MAG: chaperone modulator CbpM [Candidatus Azobacteroides sp.]|nr:chaperone modulator CbpM [Candidatus Azobacteroides sp.]
MNPDLIIVSEYCLKTQIEPSFVLLLEEVGLIEINVIAGEKYFRSEQLPDLERFSRLYYDLSVNMEGIDVINHLLNKMEVMRQEIIDLKHQLRLYLPE